MLLPLSPGTRTGSRTACPSKFRFALWDRATHSLRITHKLFHFKSTLQVPLFYPNRVEKKTSDLKEAVNYIFAATFIQH